MEPIETDRCPNTGHRKSIGTRLVILPLGDQKVLYVDGSPASSKVTLGEAINTVLLMWSLRKGRFSQRMD